MKNKFSTYIIIVFIVITSCTKENQTIDNIVNVTINNRSSYPLTNVKMYLSKYKSSKSKDTLTNELLINDITPRSTVNFDYDCRNKITESEELIYIEYYFKGKKKNSVYMSVFEYKLTDDSLAFTVFVDGSVYCESDGLLYWK
jgi:hypothetical protein